MKGKPPREIRNRREVKPRKKRKRSRSKANLDYKFWLGIAIAILGTTLTAIALRARPTVSLDPALDPHNVFTTPIVISNDGMMAINVLSISTLRSLVTYREGTVQRHELSRICEWKAQTLDTGQKRTVFLSSFVAPATYMHVTYADVSLIVQFNPAYLPFIARKNAYRLITTPQADGGLRLESEPGSLKEYEELKEQMPLFTEHCEDSLATHS